MLSCLGLPLEQTAEGNGALLDAGKVEALSFLGRVRSTLQWCFGQTGVVTEDKVLLNSLVCVHFASVYLVAGIATVTSADDFHVIACKLSLETLLLMVSSRVSG